MLPRSSIPALAALGLGLSLGIPGLAQRGARGNAGRVQPQQHSSRGQAQQEKTPIEEFETLPPEQQQKALNRLPPAQRQKLQERLQRFNALPPQQQQALRALYNRLHQLPPERQEAVRKAVNKLSGQPANRQQAMREELRNIAALPASERQVHMTSPDFRSRFSKKEQEILRDMSPLLPER